MGFDVCCIWWWYYEGPSDRCCHLVLDDVRQLYWRRTRRGGGPDIVGAVVVIGVALQPAMVLSGYSGTDTDEDVETSVVVSGGAMVELGGIIVESILASFD